MPHSYPNVILPGYLAGAQDYLPIADQLRAQGKAALVVPLQWWEWLPTVGGRSIAPILVKLDATIKQAKAEFATDRVNIIAHSAGGWIARIYLGDQPYYGQAWQGRSHVAQLVCLGTPQRSLEPWTVKNLGFVNETYPEAFYSDVDYICVAGNAVTGAKNWRNLAQWLAYSSYELTIGTGESSGDGITPIAAAHLQGATNLTIDGVYHSPRSGTWYGTPAVLSQWAAYLK